MLNKLRKNLARIIAPAKNAMNFANDFLINGNKSLTSKWSEVVMGDIEKYRGYSYAAIHKRAIYTARVGSENVKLHEDKEGKIEEHPYMPLIYDSQNFSEFMFWYALSTFLDLFGIAYILVIRANDPTREKGKFSRPKEFKILNPLHITRIVNPETLEVEGYIEVRGAMQRELPKDMVIEIRDLNPFSDTNQYAVSDAAKDSQFTLLTAGDYNRKAIRNNINSPGIIGTGVILEEELFKNFIARMKSHGEGEPVFGNGAGAVTWTPMTIDLTKAALPETHQMSREQLFVIFGTSKTIMGMEESGTTRETAKVQKDLFIETEIITRIQFIIDALNLDYRIHYPQDYEKNQAFLIVNNPQATDHDAELKDIEVKQSDFDLFTSLVNKGYDTDIAAQYVKGEISVSDLGEPTNPPVNPLGLDPLASSNQPNQTETNSVKKKDCCDEHVFNALSEEDESILKRQQAILKEKIVMVEEQIVSTAINHVPKNAFEEESDIISKTDKNNYIAELAGILGVFYTIMISTRGPEVMKDRMFEFVYGDTPEKRNDPTLTAAAEAKFKITASIKKYVKNISERVADHHVETVVNDILETARQAALDGLGHDEIVSAIKANYTTDISTVRANTIARTETNRAFTRSQFEADQQFIESEDLEGRAYKRWRTRSDNPCAFCQALEDEGEVPFDEPFRGKGSTVKVNVDGSTKELDVNFETVQSGNLHPNCSCDYQLIIRKEKK